VSRRPLALASAFAAGLLACSALAGCTQPGFGQPVTAAVHPVIKPPSSLLYLGVHEPGGQSSYAGVTRFGAVSGVRPNVVLAYASWRDGFDFQLAYRARANGAEPLIGWQPAGVSLAAIAAGRRDRYLRMFANEVRRFGGPVILSFAPEMTSPQPRSSRPGTSAVWVAAWRHVVTVFRHQRAANVTWLWTVSHAARLSRLRAYWPGPSYVDWVGTDGYLLSPADTYASVFGPSIAAIRQVTGKPILIARTAVSPSAGREAADVAGLFAGVRRDHLLGLIWFDQPGPGFTGKWLSASQRVLAAFQAGVRACVW
jgi:mannan endo-1,4-beta-mannosidase